MDDSKRSWGRQTDDNETSEQPNKNPSGEATDEKPFDGWGKQEDDN